MKTKIILLALLSCVFNTAFAQLEKVTTIEGDLRYIHPDLTVEGKVILYSTTWNEGNTTFQILDNNFNVLKTISTNEDVDHICHFYNLDNGLHIHCDGPQTIYLTQNLFNDDELFEYIVEYTTYEYPESNNSVYKFKIINENGVVLAEIKLEDNETKCNLNSIFILNGETYILIEIDNDPYQYQIWKVDKKSTAVNKVAEYKAEAGKSFDIAGRRMNKTASHNSIIIEDGVKHIK